MTNKIEGKNILITGGAGFIGCKLASRFIESNKIFIFDNFTRNSLQDNPIKNHENFNLIEGDILNLRELTTAATNANIIIHCAAIAGIDNTINSPVTTMKVNMMGTLNVLEAAANVGSVERLVDFSTSEVFGSRAYMVEEVDSTVTGAVGEARWTYAVSKLAGEHLAHAYHREYGLPTVTIRPFNIYGPGQVGEGAIAIMIRKALKDETINIFGDGNQIRAWCYIDDLLDGIQRTLTSEKAVGESFNIGNARAITTIYGLAQTICNTLGSKSEIKFRDALSADIELRIPKVDKAKRLLDFSAQTDLNEGILKTAQWITENDKSLPPIPSMFN